MIFFLKKECNKMCIESNYTIVEIKAKAIIATYK